jgi:hypothetical protein
LRFLFEQRNSYSSCRSSVAVFFFGPQTIQRCSDLSVGGIFLDSPFLQSRGSGLAIFEVVTAEGSLYF